MNTKRPPIKYNTNRPSLKYSFKGTLITNARSGDLKYKYAPLKNLITKDKNEDDQETYLLSNFNTKNLPFDLEHPLSILPQESFDGSVNLIINDNINRPRLINTRFSTAENDTFIVPDHYGNKDTTLYEDDNLDIDTSLYKTITQIPKLSFDGLDQGGHLKSGAYHFYFKLADNDDNETDFILESSVVMCHIGTINDPFSIRMGLENEDSNKVIKFTLSNLDNSYDFIKVYYTRSTSGQEGSDITTAHSINYKFPIVELDTTQIIIYGTEPIIDIDIRDINPKFEYVDYAKSQTICQNRLFFGNVQKPVVPYEELKEFSLRIIPEITQEESIGSLDTNYEDYSFNKDKQAGYFNAKNIYYRTGLWPGEYYRYGIVYILSDFTLSPVFNIRGRDFNYESQSEPKYQTHSTNYVQYDEKGKIIGSSCGENIHGIIHIKEDINLLQEDSSPIGIKFTYKDLRDDAYDRIKNKVKGFFIVRQKRLPITIAQGIAIGKTKNHFGNLPCLQDQIGYFTESFLDSNEHSVNVLNRSIVRIDKKNVEIKAALIPDATIREPLFNQIFTSQDFKYKPYVSVGKLIQKEPLRYVPYKSNWELSNKLSKSAKFTQVNSGIQLTTNGTDYFSSKAGEAEITSTFSSVLHNWESEGSTSKEKLQINSLTKGKPRDHMAMDLMSDKLIRGLFGHYVGISDNDLEYGEVFNIKDKSYVDLDDSQTSIIYQDQQIEIRKNSSDPYYAVSEREELNKIESGIVCYRGDCFICNYTHRMIRNFIDPELPTNDKVIEPSSWHNNFVVLTKFSTIVDGERKCINEVVPLFKAKMINDGEDGGDWEKYQSNVLAPGDSSKWDNELSKKLAATDNDVIDWTSDRAKMTLPSESSYTKRGQFGETIGVPNTWYEGGLNKISRSDINSVGLGHWVTFRILSNHNLCMRDIDQMETKERVIFNKPRSFFPLEQLSLSSQNKIAESNKINGACNKVLSERLNFIGMLTPYDKQQFDTRIMFSDLTTSDAYKNGFRVFTGLNYKDYPKTYGALTAIREFGGNIIAVMEHGVLLIPVNERSLSGAGAGGATFINTSITLPDNPMVISPNFGSSWEESVITTENYLYGIDTSGKKIWRTDGQQMEILTDFKLQKFLNDNITLKEWDKFVKLGFRNVKTHYNAFKKDVMFTFYNGETSWNLCYNEYLKIFTTFYSWTPSYSENIDNIFISFDLEDTKNIINSSESDFKKVYSDSIINFIIPEDIKEDHEVFSVGDNIGRKSGELILKDDYKLYPDNKYFELRKEYGGQILKFNLDYKSEIESKKNLTVYFKRVVDSTSFEDLNIRLVNKLYQFNTLWKHGQAGVIDNQGKIKPTNWYDKQENFELEVVVATNAAVQKIYNNLLLISNKAKPEEFSFEIVGESYDWFTYKDIINWINENSPTDTMRKELYRLVLSNTQGMIQQMYPDYPKLPNKPDNYTIRKLPYIRRVRKDRTGSYIDDQFEMNSTEVQLIQDELLSEQRINISQKGNDIKKLGRIAGNMEYKEDSWRVEIRPINFKYAYLDNDGNLQFMKENSSRIRDKYCKIRVKYSGEDLVILQGLKTLFNYSYA